MISEKMYCEKANCDVSFPKLVRPIKKTSVELLKHLKFEIK